jgi:hypothetical protein
MKREAAAPLKPELSRAQPNRPAPGIDVEADHASRAHLA